MFFLVLVFLPFYDRVYELIVKTRSSKGYVAVAFCPLARTEKEKIANHIPVCQLILVVAKLF